METDLNMNRKKKKPDYNLQVLSLHDNMAPSWGQIKITTANHMLFCSLKHDAGAQKNGLFYFFGTTQRVNFVDQISL